MEVRRPRTSDIPVQVRVGPLLGCPGALSRSGTTSSSGCKPPGPRGLAGSNPAAPTTSASRASHDLRAQGKTASRRRGAPETRGASPRGPTSRPRRSKADRLRDMEEMPVRVPPRARGRFGHAAGPPRSKRDRRRKAPWEFDSPTFLQAAPGEVWRRVSRPVANGDAPCGHAGSTPALSSISFLSCSESAGPKRCIGRVANRQTRRSAKPLSAGSTPAAPSFHGQPAGVGQRQTSCFVNRRFGFDSRGRLQAQTEGWRKHTQAGPREGSNRVRDRREPQTSPCRCESCPLHPPKEAGPPADPEWDGVSGSTPVC
jgi:hypothetical protein